MQEAMLALCMSTRPGCYTTSWTEPGRTTARMEQALQRLYTACCYATRIVPAQAEARAEARAKAFRLAAWSVPGTIRRKFQCAFGCTTEWFASPLDHIPRSNRFASKSTHDVESGALTDAFTYQWT
jgi:hypothetical protein